MRLSDEPPDIPTAIYQSTLVHLAQVTGTTAVVVVGEKEESVTRIHYAHPIDFSWENMKISSFTGPLLSNFLMREVRIRAFSNMKRERERARAKG